MEMESWDIFRFLELTLNYQSTILLQIRSYKKGVGHLQGTSLPVGGKSTHVALSGHRGLPSSSLFTDLDLLEIGDIFYMEVLGNTSAYKIDQIKNRLHQQKQKILKL